MQRLGSFSIVKVLVTVLIVVLIVVVAAAVSVYATRGAVAEQLSGPLYKKQLELVRNNLHSLQGNAEIYAEIHQGSYASLCAHLHGSDGFVCHDSAGAWAASQRMFYFWHLCMDATSKEVVNMNRPLPEGSTSCSAR